MSIKPATIIYPNSLKVWYNIIVPKKNTKSTEMKGFEIMNIYEYAMNRAKSTFERAMKAADYLIEEYPDKDEYTYSYFDEVGIHAFSPRIETMLKYGILTRREEVIACEKPTIKYKYTFEDGFVREVLCVLPGCVLASIIVEHGTLKSVDAHAVDLDKGLKDTVSRWLYSFNPEFLENAEEFFAAHLREVVMAALDEVLSEES